MKSFNDWQMSSQLLLAGMAPVIFSVVIVGSSFFIGLYELKNDAFAAQRVISDMRCDSNLYSSELREYLINYSGKLDNTELLKEIGQVSQRLKFSLTIYSDIAKEGEAANSQTLSEITKIIEKLDLTTSKVKHSNIDIYGFNQELEDLEKEIINTFKHVSSVADREVNIEMALLSWLVIGTSLISLFAGFIFVRKISEKIVGEILILKNISKNFGDGKLSERVNIRSLNELGQLSSAFNNMANDLQKTLVSLEQENDLRKFSEQELKKSHLELEHRVEERSKELELTYQQLAHAGRLTALGEMATGIAHEIRQPLTIIGLANLYLENYFEKKNANIDLAKSSTLKIKEQIDRADNIINNMRSFARTNISDFKSINLADPVRIAASFFKEQCRLHQIDLKVENNEPLPLVYADPQKIEQIVVNLISNARYAVETKSLNFKNEYQMQIFLKLYHDSKKKEVILEITDNGLGMTIEEKEKCLNPFFTTKQVGQGTGLGLSIVYNIIQEFEGKMEIKSEKNIGSTFRILIPVKEELHGH